MKIIVPFLLILTIFISAFIIFPEYKFPYFKNWPKPAYNFSQNKLTPEKILLGRALFYDPILSKDSSICASCHSQYTAFAHVDHALSHGIDNRIGTRNAPALMAQPGVKHLCGTVPLTISICKL